LEVVGNEKISKAGFGGLMKSQQKISIVVGSVMFTAWAFLEVCATQSTNHSFLTPPDPSLGRLC
jgi:hypothetical protein